MQRPRAITLIGLLFIAVGVVGLLNDLWPLLTPRASEHLARLRSEGLADLGPAWTSRVAAIVGGIGLLRGRNWARWLLAAWMVFHIGLSLLHSMGRLAIHLVLFLPILYLLFVGSSRLFFRKPNPSAV